MYGFLTAAAPEPEVVARVLAETFRVPLQSVDVSPASEMDDRNWDATVTCDYELLPGDLPGQLSVYGAEEVPDQPRRRISPPRWRARWPRRCWCPGAELRRSTGS